MNKNNYVAIMAGGIGSRFWPMSRSHYPKQFLDILHTGETLLQATFKRFRTFIPEENIYIVTSEAYVDIVHTQLPGLKTNQVLSEPERRNTAPCIAYVATRLLKLNPEANLIVAPSDHLITDEEQFRINCLAGLERSRKNSAFVTLGIRPNHANTGYGYIQYEKNEDASVKKVIRFTEKPDRQTAECFLEAGNYLWNSGIFIWTAANIMTAFQEFMPGLYQLFEKAKPWMDTPEEEAAIREVYGKCESISIDYAILEKASNILVIPATFSWSDLGTWNSAWENFSKDGDKNAITGSNALMIDSNGCLVHSSKQQLMLLGGVKDLIVVNTEDVLLICTKENEQQIKDYLTQLKEVKGVKYL